MITTIGPHRVQHGNVMDGIDALMDGKKADLVYTDPPWGQGLVRYWQTKNKKDTGAEPPDLHHADLLNKLFSIAAEISKGTVIVEYGMKWRDEIALTGLKHGLKHRGCVMAHYRSGSKIRPCDIHLFSDHDDCVLTPAFAEGMEGLCDYPVVDWCFQNFAPKEGIVVDPMCGLGSTAKAALDYGLTFYGNEFNSKRLEKTIAMLEAGK